MPLPQRQGDRFDRIRGRQRGRRTQNGCHGARLIHARGGACGHTCGRAHHVGRRGSRPGRCRHDHVSGRRNLLPVCAGDVSRWVHPLSQLLLSLRCGQQRGTSVNHRPGTRRRRRHDRLDLRCRILLHAIFRIPPGSHTHGRHTFFRCRCRCRGRGWLRCRCRCRCRCRYGCCFGCRYRGCSRDTGQQGLQGILPLQILCRTWSNRQGISGLNLLRYTMVRCSHRCALREDRLHRQRPQQCHADRPGPEGSGGERIGLHGAVFLQRRFKRGWNMREHGVLCFHENSE